MAVRVVTHIQEVFRLYCVMVCQDKYNIYRNIVISESEPNLEPKLGQSFSPFGFDGLIQRFTVVMSTSQRKFQRLLRQLHTGGFDLTSAEREDENSYPSMVYLQLIILIMMFLEYAIVYNNILYTICIHLSICIL